MIDLRDAAARASDRVRAMLDATAGDDRGEAVRRHPSQLGSAFAHRAARVRRALERHLRRDNTDPELAERLAVAEVVVDDRIRARRENVERERRDELRREIVALVGAVLVAALLIGIFVFTPLLHVRDVEVRGTGRLPAPEVLSAAALDGSDMVLEVDPSSVAARVESLPWVRTATVRRHFPWRVTIDVDERTAVGRVTSGDTVSILDAEGRLLDSRPVADADEIAAGLPEIAGTHPLPPVGGFWRDKAATRALAAAGRLPSDALPRLTRLELIDGALVAMVTEALRVELGTPEDGDMAEKGRVALAVLADLERRGVGEATVDVTVPKAPALRPGPPQQTQPAGDSARADPPESAN